MGSHSGPPSIASGISSPTMARTVVRTGRNRASPASTTACLSGSPLCFVSSMKSNSTMTWEMISPASDATPRNAHEPEGRAHDGQPEQPADDTERDRGVHQQRPGVGVELHDQREVDRDEGD